jgi:glycosyltransferase involved in cell wall biosynthesis
MERGYPVLWVAPSHSEILRRAEHSGLDRHVLSGRRPSPLSILSFRRALKKRGIRILHTNDPHATTWGTVATVGQEDVIRVAVKHTNFPLRSAAKYNWFIDRLICVSNSVRETCLQGGVLASKLEVIYGGVEASRVDRVQARARAAVELGISRERPLFVAVGSLIPCKGYEVLLPAMDLLRHRIPDAYLAICGEGSLRSKLEQECARRQLGSHVRLLGFREDSTAWIAAADTFVHAAHFEGLSLATIEAQMLGTPVVATDTGGLSEVLRDPRNGHPVSWICPTNDHMHLSELMADSLNNLLLRRAWVSAAQTSATQRFSRDRMVDRYEDCLTETMHPSRQSKRRVA